MNSKILVFALTFLLINLVNIINSHAQDSNEIIINKLESLERDIRDVQRKVYQGKDTVTSNSNSATSNALNSKGIADHELRLIELEENFRTTNGIIEELNYKIDMLSKQNKELLSKLDLIKLEKKDTSVKSNLEKKPDEKTSEEYPIYPGMSNKKDNEISENEGTNTRQENNSTVEVLATINNNTGNDQIIKTNVDQENDNLELDNSVEINIDNTVISSPRSPEEIYQRAYNMLSNGDYAAAEIAFIKFIKNNADHSLSSNAYYWLGETFYVRKNYQLAAYNFAAGYKKFPKGAKAPDQLLKLGISLYSLDKNIDACSTFKKLDKDFTNLPPRISNRSKTFKEKLDCK